MMISNAKYPTFTRAITLAISLAAILAGFAPSAAYRKAFDVKKMSPKFVREEARRLLMHPKITQSITQAVQSG